MARSRKTSAGVVRTASEVPLSGSYSARLRARGRLGVVAARAPA
jgi:hypothetical protein